jgi:hypothetical protein
MFVNRQINFNFAADFFFDFVLVAIAAACEKAIYYKHTHTHRNIMLSYGIRISNGWTPKSMFGIVFII